MAGKPSLMEIKRQQWAREREEAQSDWSPWGRPGGGAPLKWHRNSDRNDARLAPAENKKDTGFLPPLNVYSHQHPPQPKPVTPTPAPLPLPPPPPPPPRRSPRNVSQTDGETSGYHSDNHLVDPTSHRHHAARHRPEPLQPAVTDHHHHHLQQLPTSRSFHVPPQTSVSDHHYLQLIPQGSLPIPPHTSVSEHYHHGHDHAGMPRADYKFLERRKWIQDGTVPYELYGDNLPHGVQDRSAPPRWVARPHQQQSVGVQGEPPLSDRTSRDQGIHHNPPGTANAANAAAPNFLRGQNVVLDAAAIAEREAKRAKAAELQRILLQQLAEKENQKMLERKKQEEYERRQEEELRRQIEIERRQIEDERKRAQEKKDAEERRMAAVREAIAGAQQNALAEKAARKRAMQQHAHSTSISSSDPAMTTTAVASDEMSSATPVVHQQQRTKNRHRTRSDSPEMHRDHCRLVDTAVQTEQPFKPVCHCGNKSRFRQDASPRIPATASERDNGRPATQMSIALKSQCSNPSVQSRPRWNAHQTNAKYQSQTEKDPRFLNRRRERLRRRQKLLLEKQLHGSWPSSENSGSQEDMGDTFFPVLPGSGAGEVVAHERYYEAHQAAAVSCNQYKKPKPPPPPQQQQQHEKPVTNQHHHHHNHHPHHKVESRLAVVEPPFMPPDPPVKQSRPASPPVPAVLKKMQMLSGEKHEWENEQPPETANKDAKMEKELENQQIREQHAPCTEDEKEDLLFRLSLLKKGLEKMRADLDAVSLTSSN